MTRSSLGRYRSARPTGALIGNEEAAIREEGNCTPAIPVGLDEGEGGITGRLPCFDDFSVTTDDYEPGTCGVGDPQPPVWCAVQEERPLDPKISGRAGPHLNECNGRGDDGRRRRWALGRRTGSDPSGGRRTAGTSFGGGQR